MAHASMGQPGKRKLSGDHTSVPLLSSCVVCLCVVALLFPLGVRLTGFPWLTLVTVTPSADGGRAGFLNSSHCSPAISSI